MADASPVMPGPEQAEAAERLMDAANRLEVGGIIFLLIIAVIILIGFALWLKSKSDARKAENRKLELEQEGKNERARLLAAGTQAQADSISKLATEVHGMRQDAVKHNRNLGDAMADQSAKLTALIQGQEELAHERDVKRDARLTEIFGSLSTVMNELLERQKGTINFDDALRIIDECFDRSIKAQAISIAEQSLRANHWADESKYIEERVTTELQSMMYHAERNLGNYQLSVDHRLFFPGKPEGPYDLALELWGVIKALHEEGTVGGVSLEQRVKSSKIRIANTVNSAFNEAKAAAIEIYATKNPGAGGTRRFRTPLPESAED